MYRRRATLVTFHSLRPFTKVCCRTQNPSSFFIDNLKLSRIYSTALERPDYYNVRNQPDAETKPNEFQQNQNGYGYGNLGQSQNPRNQFQHYQNGGFGPRNEFSESPGYKNGNLGQNQNTGNQFGYNQNRNFGPGYVGNGNEYRRGYGGDIQGNGNGYGSGYGQGGLASSRNGVGQSGEVNGGYNQSSNGGYSGGGNLQQGWGGGNYGGNYINSQRFSLKPENVQQSWNSRYPGVRPGNMQQGWNAGYSGKNFGNSQQSWNTGHSAGSSGNLQQGWNTGYSGKNSGNSQQGWNTDQSAGSSINSQQGWNTGYSDKNSGNLQQSWNTDHSVGNSGNSQHGWGAGYSDGSSGHPSQNWNRNNTQNAGMHQETSHDNYAKNGGTLQFRQGNYNSNNLGIYHGNTGFSNNQGNVIEYQQITGGTHKSDAGFVQPSNQLGSGFVGILGQSSVKSNEESEVIEGDQLKGTMEELDKFSQEHKLKEAVDVLALLEGQCITVDLQRYLLLFKACGEEEALEEGKSIHKHLLRSGLHLELETHNVILKMYCNCGSLEDAFDCFDKMPGRNLTTWDTMISYLAKNGHGEEAISMFTKFKESGLNPDGRMFLSVFSACGVIGDTVEGLLHFESMKNDYSIAPSMEHYISVIDMLGTAGNLDEALEFIEKNSLEPNIEVWEVLMNLCRMHGNLELGDRCAEIVEVLDPSRLDEQSRAGYLPLKLAELGKDKEKKKSGQIFPEGRSRVHEYRAGDKSQPELYELLRGMRQQLKEAGYIPEVKFVLHDIDQEAKEEALMAHSERLAVAQGLMTSPARNPIRIIKNLRICVDCHTTMKIVSKLVGRELIIRDAKRFHHFKDGLCSCRDYW